MSIDLSILLVRKALIIITFTALDIQKSILKVLAYFDVFHHPLLISEIREFLDQKIDENEIGSIILEMTNKGLIFHLGPFYSLRNDVELIARRQNGNVKASRLLKTANKIARFLYRFPFVRAVGISGSLSKNYADEGTDIDFFIITATNNLWLARSILHGFKKLTFLIGKQHWYCMNYFIDESSLKIPEENIFTATEVVTFMPVIGKDAVESFYQTNQWAFLYFPNRDSPDLTNATDDQKHIFKPFTEFLLNNSFGQYLDDLLMRMTYSRWKKKEEAHKNNMKGEPIGLNMDKHIARPNPAHLQKKILGMLDERYKRL